MPVGPAFERPCRGPTPRPSGSPPCRGRAPPGCTQGSPRTWADSESPEVQPLLRSPARSRAPLELPSVPAAGPPHLPPLPLPSPRIQNRHMFPETPWARHIPTKGPDTIRLFISATSTTEAASAPSPHRESRPAAGGPLVTKSDQLRCTLRSVTPLLRHQAPGT